MFDSILSAAAPVLGPVLGYIGQRQTNDTNKDIAHDANVMSQANAREQMAFQERMSNTSHAREVADLKNAGLNPILSVNQGSSTPQGAAGSVQTATMENPMEALASSALGYAQLRQQMIKQEKEIELMSAQTKKTNVEAKVASKGVPEAEIKNLGWEAVKPWLEKFKALGTTKAEKGPKVLPKHEVDKLINEADSDRAKRLNRERLMRQMKGIP